MKKYQLRGTFIPRLYRVCILSCFFCVFYLSPSVSFGQSKGITLDAKATGATALFSQIEQQSSYKFFYKTEQVKQLKNITIQTKDSPVAKVLDEILKGTAFTYEINGEQIIILEKPIEKKTDVLVSGNVKDASGEPLIGVTVIIKGTTTGVTTDINGNFSLQTNPDNILQFRFLGMKDLDMGIPASHYLAIVMQENAQTMEEVIVTGYGNFKKSTYTGSASVVSTEKMENLPVVSITQMLEANLPGLSTFTGSGQAGSTVSLRVRGIGSFNASNEPLYVLDGVPILSGNLSGDDENGGGLGFLSTLNPSDIENITVLKDAASASLYGARGANGVILITTKKGSQGKTSYNFKVSYGTSDLAYDYREIMGGEERRQLIHEGFVNYQLDRGASQDDALLWADEQTERYAAKPKDGYADWIGAMFRRGHQQNYDFSASGGNANTQFAGSFNYTKQQGITVNSGFERFGGHINVNNNYKKFDVALNAIISLTKKKGASEGGYFASPMYSSRYSLTPSTPIRNEDGSYNTNLSLNGNVNPLLEWEVCDNSNQVIRTFASIEAGYTILKGLKLSSLFNVDFTHIKDFHYYSPLGTDGAPSNGEGNVWMYENIRYNSSTKLSYNESFKQHNLSATLAYEIQHYDHEGIEASAKNYASTQNPTLSNAATPVSISQPKSADALLSYVASINYNYASKYYLSLSFRRDGSSHLAKDNRWENFWSVSGSWRISQENFMTNYNNWLSDLKIRASYGVNGNLPTDFYGHYKLFSTSASYNENPAILESNLGNSNLSWEKNYALNVGVDLTLFNRISLTFDYYKRNTKDLLMKRPVNTISGFSSMWDNIGEMENKGFEIDIRSTNIRKNDFTWTSALNMAHNKNKIIKLADQPEFYAHPFIRKEGYSYGTLAMREYAGVDPDNGKPMYYSNQPDEKGVRSREIVDDPNLAAIVPLKDIYPTLTGGFTNTFQYKFIDLSFNLSFSLGGWSYDNAMWAGQDDGYDPSANKSTALRNRWKKPGDKTSVPRYVYGQEYGGWWHSSRGIHSTDHLRLKSLIIGVSAPKNWLNRIGFATARVYFSGSNLLTWAVNDLYDPEYNDTVHFGIPPLKTYAFGIEFGF